MKSQMKKIMSLFLVLGMLMFLVTGCGNGTAEEEKKSDTATENGVDDVMKKADEETDNKDSVKMGVSYAYTNMASLQYQVTCYEEECKKRGWELTLLDAGNDVEQQVADIESLIDGGCDFMVIFPVDQTAGLTAVKEVKEAGIPLVFFSYAIDGAVWGEDYLSVATGDNKEQGACAADYIHENWEAAGFSGDVKYINLEGPVANACAEDRSAGFTEKAEEYGFVEVATQCANWSRSEAQEVVTNIIQSTNGDFNCIYSANEEMLFGAIAALEQAGIDPSTVMTIGVDVTFETCDAIKDGSMTGIVFYDQADLVDGSFRTWDALQSGADINEITGLTLTVVDKNNFQEYLDAGKVVS